MREAEVPQEGNATHAGLRKALYAQDADGRIKLVRSAGWEVEEIVTRQALDELGRRAEEARERALRGEASPLEYHMYRARMDVALLAQTTGLWRWRVKRHLKPGAFRRLPESLLKRYAAAMGIPVDALRDVAP